MMTKDSGGAAFPVTNGGYVHESGMSMRDWFAGQAMMPTFLLALETIKTAHTGARYNETDLAEAAYRFADAMIEARK